MKQKNRDISIDIMKCLMILTVAVYHLIYRKQGGMPDTIIRQIGYLTIPMFIMISGYFYRPSDSGVLKNMWKRIKTILIPSVLTTAGLLLVCGPYYMLVWGYDIKQWITDILCTYLRPELMTRFFPEYSNSGQLFNNLSPVWFIWTMVFACVIFYLVVPFVYDSYVKISCAAAALILIGAVMYAYLPAMSWSIQISPLYAGIMMVGTILHKHNVAARLSEMKLYIAVPIAVVCAVAHYFIFIKFGSDLMYMSILGEKTIPVALIFVVQVLVGGFALNTVARLISYVKYLGDFTAWLGSNTFTILLWHALLGGIAADIMHTYNKPGPNWYLDPLPTDVLVKSFISFFVSIAGCIVVIKVKELIKKKRA